MAADQEASVPVIAIVGAGFSGTMLASHLMRRATRPLRILLIERTGRFGTGLAYGTSNRAHVLNVSAGAMSAWPNDPSHLLRWLELNRSGLSDVLPEELDASSFIPRQVYGLYLQSILSEATSKSRQGVILEQISDEVIDIAAALKPSPRYQLHLKESEAIPADQVILAWGNATVERRPSTHGLVRHGWDGGALDNLDPDATVLLLGTGLTMMDLLLSLQKQGHRGPVLAVSRRGLRPNPHRKGPSIGRWLEPDQAPNTVLGLWRVIRNRVRQAQHHDEDWRSIIDGLRPVTQKLWGQLNEQERSRFLRHAAVFWDVHRHRIAPDVYNRLVQMEASGQLHVIAGRITSHTQKGNKLSAIIRPRGSKRDQELIVDRLIQCTGIPLNYAHSKAGIVGALQKRGLIHADPLGLGARCTNKGEAVQSDGAITAGLYFIGSPRKGMSWETIAVPELRQQALDLADTILTSLPRFLHSLPPRTPEHLQTRESNQSKTVFRQLFDRETCTYTYLIGDAESRNAILVDPVLEQVERDIQLLRELGLNLKFCLETHLHADHVTGAGQLRRRTGCQVVVPAANGISGADQTLKGGEILDLDGLKIQVIATPGHTAEHVAYRVGDQHLLTGDALLIRGCGRTDFQNGDASQLYDSLQELLKLPGQMLVWPCHDYQGRSYSTIDEERQFNPRVAGRSREAFITLMQSLSLDPPKRIHEAVPANLHLGDLIPAEHHAEELERAEQKAHGARIIEDTNREIYNSFIGMFI